MTFDPPPGRARLMPRRTFLRLGLCASVTTLIGGCQLLTTATPTATLRSVPVSQSRPTAVAFKPASGPVTLRLVAAVFPNPTLEDVLAPFRSANPTINVDVEYLPDAAAVARRVREGLAGTTPPDAFVIDSGWIAGFAERDQVLGLEFQVRAGQLGDFPTALLTSATWSGHLYALPVRSATSVILFRKDHFQEAGLDPQAPPQTWESLAAAAQRLTRRDADGSLIRAGFDPVGGAVSPADHPRHHFFRFLWQNGVRLFTGPNAQAQVNFTSPEAVEALDWWLGLIHDQHVSSFGFRGSVIDGSAAMGSYPDNIWRDIQQHPEVSASIGILPSIRRRDVGEWIGGDVVAITRATKYPAEAWSLVEYLTSLEGMLRADIAIEALPARISLQTADHVRNRPVLAGALRQLQIAKPESGPVRWPELEGLWDEALIDALRTPRPARDVLDTLARRANDVLAQPAAG
jgi:ABC-type glycerol-3-phosphate transport system substrate-binding protein